jgi:MscS family membrane protein
MSNLDFNSLENVFLGNSLQNWAMSLGIIFSTLIFSKLISSFLNQIGLKLTKKTKTNLDDLLFDTIQKPLTFALILIGVNIGLSVLNMPEAFFKAKNSIFFVLLTLDIAWAIDRSLRVFVENVIHPIVAKSDSTLDDQILPLAHKLSTYLIWSLALIIGLDNAGYDAGAILAGLGIGGLAFALAAQDSVSNIFGGLTIFIDKPFIINDRILLDGIDGYVQEIGIRSTKIKQLDGRIVTIPNSKFTDNAIRNITSEPNRKVSMVLGLTYDTNESQIQLAMATLKNIAQNTDGIADQSIAAFTNFGGFSLDITFIYYINKDADIFESQNRMNLSILSEFNRLQLDFAFPTQTLVHQNLKEVLSTKNFVDKQSA